MARQTVAMQLLAVDAVEAVAIVPFALKPVIALLSDAFPIGGYHKLPYVARPPDSSGLHVRCKVLRLCGFGF